MTHEPTSGVEAVREAVQALTAQGKLSCWVNEDEHTADFLTIRAALATPAASPATGEDWPHIANEWADTATNGLEWLRNIRDGISTPAEAIANMEACIKRCGELRKTPPASPSPAPAAVEPVIGTKPAIAHDAKWCQPGDMQAERHFIVRFDDAEMKDCVFTDEAEAREFWAKATVNWNCWLFAAMPIEREPTPAAVACATVYKQDGRTYIHLNEVDGGCGKLGLGRHDLFASPPAVWNPAPAPAAVEELVARLADFRLRWQDSGDLTYLGKALVDAITALSTLAADKARIEAERDKALRFMKEQFDMVFDGRKAAEARALAAETALAAREVATDAVPGWKLVPVEPTPEMYIAGGTAWCEADERFRQEQAETGVEYTAADPACACYAAMLAASPAPALPGATFKPGDRVTKTKGSNWTGRVVGTYSTALTPEGYAVESETEKGSVQIYPASALALAPALPGSEVDIVAWIESLPREPTPALRAALEKYRELTALATPAPAPAPESGMEDGDNGSGPYTCTACLSSTWNDDDRCDSCREEALAASVPAPAPAPAPVDAAGLVARLEAAVASNQDPHVKFRHADLIAEAASALTAAAKREAALEEKVRQSALDYLALDMQATEALEREAALVKANELLAKHNAEVEAETEHWARLACDDLGKNPPVFWKERAEAAEARVTAAEAERDKMREALEAVFEWYDRDGSVGGSADVFEAARAAVRKETTA